MEWYKGLVEQCVKYGVEPVLENNQVFLLCPKLPDTPVQEQITELIPQTIKRKFIESPKQSSYTIVKSILGSFGGRTAKFNQSRDLVLEVTGSGSITKEDCSVWEEVHAVLKKDGYWKSWEIILNNESRGIYDTKLTEEIIKNKTREFGFSKDDILNLKIQLETSTCDEFLRSLGVEV